MTKMIIETIKEITIWLWQDYRWGIVILLVILFIGAYIIKSFYAWIITYLSSFWFGLLLAKSLHKRGIK